MKWKRKGSHPVLRVREGRLPLLEFPALADTGIVVHGFSTRAGGVSTGIYSSLNLSFTRGDKEAAVRENFRRAAETLGIKEEQFVLSDQVHDTKIRRVTAEDAGKGLVRPRDYDGVDGFVTDTPQLMLSLSFADCVPLFFVDPVHRAVGLSHSGWHGTVGRMGEVTVRRMQQEFGTDPASLICAIGPSICQDCYEISEDVADEFKKEFPDHEKEILLDKGNGKYQLDLWKTNKIILLEAGVPEKNISVTDICTCCNPELLYSHRASHGKRGCLAAFLMLK